MTLEQMARILDQWERDWADDRYTRFAKIDLIRRVAKAFGKEIIEKPIPVDELRKTSPRLAAFLEKWDDTFAKHRVDFVVDLGELLMYESVTLLGRIFDRMGARPEVRGDKC
jgi:hypothetical protein